MCVKENMLPSEHLSENYHASDANNVSFNCTKSWKIIVVLSEKNSVKTCGCKTHACALDEEILILIFTSSSLSLT